MSIFQSDSSLIIQIEIIYQHSPQYSTLELVLLYFFFFLPPLPGDLNLDKWSKLAQYLSWNSMQTFQQRRAASRCFQMPTKGQAGTYFNPRAAGGHKVAPFTFCDISPKPDELRT